MTPERMVKSILEIMQDWKYDRVSIGYPGPVVHEKPLREPYNLGKGWKDVRFAKAFGEKPVRLINDAAMQALCSDVCCSSALGSA